MKPDHLSQLKKDTPDSSRQKGKLFLIVSVITVLMVAGCTIVRLKRDEMKPDQTAAFNSSSMCINCHKKIVEQHEDSMHAKSFSNPVFQAQYFRELIPLLERNDELRTEADKCIACHDPIAFLQNKGYISTVQESVPELSGVVCDFCHRISGFKGDNPGGGNYISFPGDQKLGPFKYSTNHHHIYHELQTKSELCGICHNDVNHNGIEIKSTFTEWKKSRFAEKKINCQDCHMNLNGFLTDNKPVYDSGQAATMNMGVKYTHKKLYTHNFPGAHSNKQTAGALTLMLNADKEHPLPGEEVEVTVRVINNKIGHSMPSGSADLRMMWLELVADTGGKLIYIPAVPAADNTPFDIAGKGPFDNEILGADIPYGSRIYREINLDKDGKPTLSAYRATKILFDNRITAEEHRKEIYHFRVPTDSQGTVTITARINYLRFPGSFASYLNIEKVKAVELSRAITELQIRQE